MEVANLLPVATFIGYVIFGVLNAARASNKSAAPAAGGTGPLDVSPDLIREILSQHREDILGLRREIAEARAQITVLQEQIHKLERNKDQQNNRIIELEEERDRLLAENATKTKRIAELEAEIVTLKLKPAV